MSLPARLNIPTLLTLGRIAAVPVYAFFHGVGAFWLALIAFLFAAFTDFLDGFIARQFDQESTFGAMLDPIADKLMVITALIMFCAFGQPSLILLLSSMIMIWRELWVSGMREFAAQKKVFLPVTGLAKWKTAAQMLAITVALLHECVPLSVPLWMGELLFVGAAALTVWTGWIYTRQALESLPEVVYAPDEV